MKHNCENCSPPVIVDSFLKQLNQNILTSKEIRKLNNHQEPKQVQLITKNNYILFREAAKKGNLVLMEELIKIANECKILKAMLHAGGDEAFMIAMSNRHYKIGSLILNTINNMEDKGEASRGYNWGKKELVIKDVILKLISKLPDLALEFVIDQYDEERHYSEIFNKKQDGNKIKEDLERRGYERIIINNLSIREEGKEDGYSGKKPLAKMASIVSRSSISSIISPTPPIKFKIVKQLDKSQLHIVSEDSISTFALGDLEPPTPSSGSICGWLFSLCGNSIPPMVLIGDTTSEETI